MPAHLDSPAFARLITLHCDTLAARRFAVETIKHRRRDLTGFAQWCLSTGVTDPALVERETLAGYFSHLEHERDQFGKPRTLSGRIQRMRAVALWLAWLFRQGYLPTDPAAGFPLPKLPPHAPRLVLTEAQLVVLFSTTDTETIEGLRNRAILECLYSTGLRRSELCQLRLCDLDQAQGYVTVIAGKGGKGRSVPIGERALGWVGRYLAESRPKLLARAARPSDALFLGNRGKPMPPALLYVIVRAALDRIGLSTGLGGCHLLRHAFSTHLLQHGAGVDAIGAMLGHSDLRATPTYTHVSLASLSSHLEHCRRQLGLAAPGSTP